MKKRYQVTLTAEVADELKSILEELRLPPPTFSAIIDGALAQALPGLKKLITRLRAGEQLSFTNVVEEFQASLPKGEI